MKSKKNVPSRINDIVVKPQKVDPAKIIHVCLETNDDDSAVVAVDPDAMQMSMMYPGEPIITVYNNGIPTTMSVKQLITDTMLQVLANNRG
jgi:hypothetical protein